MYFSSTLELDRPVYYAHRMFDTKGVYVTIETYLESAKLDRTLDWMGELATETHVTNVLAEPSMIPIQLASYTYIDFTHVRLDESYS